MSTSRPAAKTATNTPNDSPKSESKLSVQETSNYCLLDPIVSLINTMVEGKYITQAGKLKELRTALESIPKNCTESDYETRVRNKIGDAFIDAYLNEHTKRLIGSTMGSGLAKTICTLVETLSKDNVEWLIINKGDSKKKEIEAYIIYSAGSDLDNVTNIVDNLYTKAIACLSEAITVKADSPAYAKAKEKFATITKVLERLPYGVEFTWDSKLKVANNGADKLLKFSDISKGAAAARDLFDTFATPTKRTVIDEIVRAHNSPKNNSLR